MKRFALIIAGLAFILSFSLVDKVDAQFANDGIYVKENGKGREPVPYQFVREADVIWKQRIWRTIDLRQKINHPLYYPTEKIGDRMSLFQLILYGIKNEGLIAYDTKDDEFTMPIGLEEIEKTFGAGPRTEQTQDLNTGLMKDTVVIGEIKPEEVKQYLIKEEWFFNKKYSTIDVRIIGICPIRVYQKDDGTGDPRTVKEKAFWIHYESARKIFANHEVYNPNNEARRISYDDLFMQRIFSSYIYKESNVYDNRLISDYAIGIQQMYEAEKIQENIFNLEHDLWEF